MNNFWNSKDLKPPLINSFKCKSPAIDLNTVISLVQNGIDTFIPPNALCVESTVMRKVIYRLKLQYRQDKGFKLFESTNRYLNQLLSFNITRDLMYLLDQIPKKYEKDMYLPSKQMLEYVLVRLQGYSQVCGRVVENAFNTANLIKSRLPVGTQLEICVVMFAITCRIWQICRHLTTKCCLLYNDLLPLLDKFQITGTKWLPDGYEFPKDLITWLKYDWLLEIPDIMLQLPLELPVFSLLDDEDDDIQYAGQYELQKNNRKSTIIILDSEDEDESETVQFLCSLSNKPVNLTKFEVKSLESKSVINVDSESDVEIINYDKSCDSKTKSIDMNDSDVFVVVDENTTDSLNISGIAPLDTKEDIKLDTVQTDNESEEIDVVNDSEGDDIGETISQELDENVLSDEESEIESSKENNNTDMNESDENNVGESVARDITSENIKPVQERNISDDWIYGNEKIYNIESLKKIRFLLDQENSLREEGLYKYCLFSHIQEDDWNFLSFQIRYLIALASDKVTRKIIYNKTKTMLHDILDEHAHDTWNSKNLVIFPDNRTTDKILLTEKRKLSFIDSIKTTKNLQIFMEVENKLRDKLFSKCFFNKLENFEWTKLYSRLKSYVILADSKPLRKMTLIKQAKLKLKKYLKNCTHTDAQNLKQTSMKKLDKLYKKNTLCTNWPELSEYFYAMLKYKDPPKLSINLKRKLFNITSDNSNKTNTNHGETSKSQLNGIKNHSENATTSAKTKNMDAIFEAVRAQADYIVAPKKRKNTRNKTGNQVLNNSKQETPKKLTKAQKRKLKSAENQSKKIKFGH